MQVGSGPSKKLSPSQVVNRVFRFSGYSGFANLLFSLLLQAKMMYCLIGSVFLNTNAGLYSGLGWLTLGRISGVGARFGVYEILTAFYKGITQIHVSFNA